ncbi:MAG: PocR ligand-binding domain-containing protein [Desulfobulbaceae bacterium]|nr:PocR ligand-binding domain-containing protein [Desulfobulbaceae bacterium]
MTEKESDIPELADIIDSAALKSLLENFYLLTGIPVGVLDLKGTVLVVIGWQDICTNFHRIHPDSCRHCQESDTELSAGLLPGEIRLYRCKNNMWDIATPIMVAGRHIGNVFMGQFFFEEEPLDYELFRAQARKYGYEMEEYIAALEAVPRFSRKFVERAMAFVIGLAQMISQLSYTNIKLTQSLAEREALTKSLRESENRLNRAQKIAHLGSWELDLINGKLIWSDEVYRIFGLAPQEFDATYEAFLHVVHPDDRSAVDEAYSSSLRQGKNSYEIEHRVVRKATGEVRIVREKCTHIRDQSGRVIRSIGMVHDITEQKQAEEALVKAKEEWEQTFDSVPDMIAIIDTGHRIRRLNKPMAQRLGMEIDACIGQPCYKYVHGTSAPPIFCPHSRTLQDGGLHVTEVSEQKLGGDFLVSTTPLHDKEGKLIGSVHVARDITERKKAEEHILSLNQQLKQNLWELKAANKELEAFSYSVSHDLRAPLRSIAGFSQVLAEDYLDKLDEEGRDALERILKSTVKMGQLIDDMLNLSRVSRSVMQHDNVNLSNIAMTIADRLMKEQPGRRAHFAIRDGITALGDEHLLRIAFENLLANAWKFTEKQNRAVIEFKTEQRGGERIFLVKDNGAGFDMTYADKLFNPFQRLHREDEFSGTGIGLATVKRIIKRHGGRVWIEGAMGKGATVYFNLGQ